jgi:hypothetical protein
MTATASPPVAGARAVRVTLTFHYVMQCDYPGSGPLVVTFPSAMRLPKQFATGAVMVAGKPVAATLDGHQVTVTIAPHKGLLCDIMGPGSVTLSFARTARITNPPQAGSYRFKASHRGHTFTAKLAIKPAA